MARQEELQASKDPVPRYAVSIPNYSTHLYLLHLLTKTDIRSSKVPIVDDAMRLPTTSFGSRRQNRIRHASRRACLSDTYKDELAHDLLGIHGSKLH